MRSQGATQLFVHLAATSGTEPSYDRKILWRKFECKTCESATKGSLDQNDGGKTCSVELSFEGECPANIAALILGHRQLHNIDANNHSQLFDKMPIMPPAIVVRDGYSCILLNTPRGEPKGNLRGTRGEPGGKDPSSTITLVVL